MGGHLLAVSGHLHLGLRVLVHCDGEVQPDVQDGEQEEEEEGRHQQQRLTQHCPAGSVQINNAAFAISVAHRIPDPKSKFLKA
jgi:hypothetical protein